MDCQPEELPASRYERKSRRNSAPRLDRIVLKARNPGSSMRQEPAMPWRFFINTLAFIGTAAFALIVFLSAFVLLEGREVKPDAGPIHGMMGAAVEMEMKR